METVRMVAFRAHMRGEGMVKRGDEFDVSEEESHAYQSRKNPLAGPLEVIEAEPAVKPTAKKVAVPAKPRSRSRKKAK